MSRDVKTKFSSTKVNKFGRMNSVIPIEIQEEKYNEIISAPKKISQRNFATSQELTLIKEPRKNNKCEASLEPQRSAIVVCKSGKFITDKSSLQDLKINNNCIRSRKNLSIHNDRSQLHVNELRRINNKRRYCSTVCNKENNKNTTYECLSQSGLIIRRNSLKAASKQLFRNEKILCNTIRRLFPHKKKAICLKYKEKTQRLLRFFKKSVKDIKRMSIKKSKNNV